MSNENFKKEDADNLVSLILSGQASEQEKGMLLRNIQVAMSANLVGHLNQMHSVVSKAMELYKDLDSAYLDKVRELLESDALVKDEIRAERDSLEKRMMAVLNMERQIIQGKSLFPQDSLSEDEQKVLRLLASVKTPDEKTKFFKAIDKFFQDSNSFEDPE